MNDESEQAEEKTLSEEEQKELDELNAKGIFKRTTQEDQRYAELTRKSKGPVEPMSTGGCLAVFIAFALVIGGCSMLFFGGSDTPSRSPRTTPPATAPAQPPTDTDRPSNAEYEAVLITVWNGMSSAERTGLCREYLNSTPQQSYDAFHDGASIGGFDGRIPSGVFHTFFMDKCS